MDFLKIAQARQSCRQYDATRPVEEEKLSAILEAVRLAPSACNGQPYHLTVCRGEVKDKVAAATMGMGLNSFAMDAPICIVISEKPYNASAAVGAKIKHNDYRSIDIGIIAAYITAAARDEELGSCILGWFDNKKIREAIGIDTDVRLVITIGYPAPDDSLREKRRRDKDELISYR